MTEGNTVPDSGTGALRPGERNRSRYILVNTLSSYGREIIDTVSFLILIPFIISTLGKESFGLWSLIWAFLGIFELADLGFAASVIKYVASARGSQDFEGLKRIICTLFWIYVFLGIMVMAGIVGSLFFFNRVFQIPPDQAPFAHAILLILGVRVAFYLPLGMFRGVLVGFQKMNVANGYKALGTLIYLPAVLILLSLYPDIRVLAAANVVTGLLPMFAMMIHAQRILPDLSLAHRYFDRSLVRELTSFSLYFSLTQIAGMIATRADTMIIKLFLPLDAVGIYSVGMRLAEYASRFCSHLTRALSPVFAELHGADERSNMRAAHLVGTKLTVAFATPLLMGLGLLAEPLIRIWTGPDFHMAVPVCRWLLGAAMIGIVHGNTVSLLSMGGHQRHVAFSIIVGQVINVLLSVALIHILGIVGVAMATFIAAVPIYAGVIQRRAGRLHEQSVWHFFRTTVMPAVIPALVMALTFLGILRAYPLTNLVEVGMVEMFGIGVFGAVYWMIGFDAKERAYFTAKARRAFFGRGHVPRPTDATVSPKTTDTSDNT